MAKVKDVQNQLVSHMLPKPTPTQEPTYDWNTYKPSGIGAKAGNAVVSHPQGGVTETPFANVNNYVKQGYTVSGTFGNPTTPTNTNTVPTTPNNPPPVSNTPTNNQNAITVNNQNIPTPTQQGLNSQGVSGNMLDVANSMGNTDWTQQVGQANNQYAQRAEDIYNRIPEQQYQYQYTDSILNSLNQVNNPFNYDPTQDKYLHMAQQNAMNQTMAEMNRRGILQSTVTADRAGQAVANLEPQFYREAYTRYQDNIQNHFMRAENLAKLDYQGFQAYQANIDNMIAKAGGFANLNQQEISRYVANTNALLNAAQQNTTDKVQKIQAYKSAFDNAVDSVNLRGYVSNQEAQILGVPAGTRSKEIQDYIRKRNDELEDKEIELNNDMKLIDKNQSVWEKQKAQIDGTPEQQQFVQNILAKWQGLTQAEKVQDFNANYEEYSKMSGQAFKTLQENASGNSQTFQTQKQQEALGRKRLEVANLKPEEVYEKVSKEYGQLVSELGIEGADAIIDEALIGLKNAKASQSKIKIFETLGNINENIQSSPSTVMNDIYKNANTLINDVFQGDITSYTEFIGQVKSEIELAKGNNYAKVIGAINNMTPDEALEILNTNSDAYISKMGDKNFVATIDAIDKIKQAVIKNQIDVKELSIKEALANSNIARDSALTAQGWANVELDKQKLAKQSSSNNSSNNSGDNSEWDSNYIEAQTDLDTKSAVDAYNDLIYYTKEYVAQIGEKNYKKLVDIYKERYDMTMKVNKETETKAKEKAKDQPLSIKR